MLCFVFSVIFVPASFSLCRFQPGSATLSRRSGDHPWPPVGRRAHGQPVHHAGGDDGTAGSADGTEMDATSKPCVLSVAVRGLGLRLGWFVAAALAASTRLSSAARVDPLTNAVAPSKPSPVMKSGQTLVRRRKAAGECACRRSCVCRRSSGGMKSTFHLAPPNWLHQDSPPAALVFPFFHYFPSEGNVVGLG